MTTPDAVAEPDPPEVEGIQEVDDLDQVDAPTLADADVDPLTGLTGAQLKGLAALREPFPEGHLLYVPRSTCKPCAERAKQYETCDAPQHIMKRPCPLCRQSISSAHIDLAYVGHAALTHRLLTVDPTWTWKPMGRTPQGTPAMSDGGMWIELTVCGVTRPGFGDPGSGGRPGKTQGEFTKEVIGDALRNAGMRFGMALDLWHKGAPLDVDDAADATPPESRPDPSRQRAQAAQQAAQPPAPAFTDEQTIRAQEILAMALESREVSDVAGLFDMSKIEGLEAAPVTYRGLTGALEGALRARAKEIRDEPPVGTPVDEVTGASTW